MLYTSSIENLGLFHGKMGVCVFFYHAAKQLHNKLYAQYAGELIDEVYNEIDLKYSFSFADGLAGIAWGMEYLIQNQFVKADSDEVLEDLDKQIVSHDIRRITDISLETGIIGLSYYILARYSSKKHISRRISIQYVYELILVLQQYANVDEEVSKLIVSLNSILNGMDVELTFDMIMSRIINNCPSSIGNLKRDNLGLYKGYAGFGMKTLKNVQI
jgi:hypothetical protein